MSVVILVGIPLVALTALTLSDTEIVRIVKELIDILARTANYSAEQIVQIIKLYL